MKNRDIDRAWFVAVVSLGGTYLLLVGLALWALVSLFIGVIDIVRWFAFTVAAT